MQLMNVGMELVAEHGFSVYEQRLMSPIAFGSYLF